MPAYGRIGDLTGRKPAFLAAIALFCVGSLVGALSTSMTSLIAARFVQGLGPRRPLSRTSSRRVSEGGTSA
jgi:MFS family permease